MTLDDLDLVETHDCFTIAELMQYEAMGLTPPGRGHVALEWPAAVRSSHRGTFDGRCALLTHSPLVVSVRPACRLVSRVYLELFRDRISIPSGP